MILLNECAKLLLSIKYVHIQIKHLTVTKKEILVCFCFISPMLSEFVRNDYPESGYFDMCFFNILCLVDPAILVNCTVWTCNL